VTFTIAIGNDRFTSIRDIRIARDQRPLRVRPKSARDYSRSAATMMAALKQARFLAIHVGRYVARIVARGKAGRGRLMAVGAAQSPARRIRVPAGPFRAV
jgi:hypothetical protein